MARTDDAISPRLARLRRALEGGDTAALPDFWREIEAAGAPLVEDIAGDETHLLVTFLWRAEQPVRNVVVTGPLSEMLGGRGYIRNQMSQLGESDLWFRTYRAPRAVRATYLLAPDDALIEADDATDWGARTATFQLDPLNPSRFTLGADPEVGDDELVYSVVAFPGAPPQPWIVTHPEVPAGTVAMFRLRSAILGNERRVWVYTPPAYRRDDAPCGLLVLFDGLVYLHDIPTPTILDNLLADGAIPPLVMVNICSLDGETRERELACYPPFVQFLTDELISWVRQRYAISTRAEHTIVGGSSYGGMAALFAGLRRPDVFGNVLAQSGAAWWKPDDDPEFEWLPRQFASADRQPLRFALDVGLLENTQRLADDGPSQLVATRHLRTVLRAKGFPVHYTEFAGGHSALNWRGTLGDAVRALAANEARV